MVVALVLSAKPSAAADDPRSTTRPSVAQLQARSALAAQCDALLESAFRTPFGWGWAEEAAEPAAPAGTGRTARPKPLLHKPVPIDSAETSVLGLELFWAGQLLGQEKYESAAFEAARGVASVRTRSGQIRAQGVMGTASGPMDVPADVPERFATRTALALMLTLIDADPEAGDAPPPAEARRWTERLKGPAAHSAFWLAMQQTNAGAWPGAYPPDAALGKAYRVIRIDDPGNRDNLCAILLAGEVLDDANLRRYATRAADELAALRLSDYRTGDRSLWGTACNLDGDPPRRFPELNNGYDLLATRYAMQALLATYLLNLRKNDNQALVEAARAIAALPKEDGKWRRFYDRRGNPAGPAPATQPGNAFTPDAAPVDDGSASAFGLGPILDAVTQIDAVGGKKYADSLSATRPLKTRLVEQVAGLSDDSLGTRLDNQAGDLPPASAWAKSSRPAKMWDLLQKAAGAARAAGADIRPRTAGGADLADEVARYPIDPRDARYLWREKVLQFLRERGADVDGALKAAGDAAAQDRKDNQWRYH